jgi:hypothetical protein
MLRARWPVVLFVGWSLYVWATRIVNALGDDQANQPVSVALALSVLVPVVMIGAVLVGARARALSATEVRLFEAVAGWTALVWLVRGVEIVLSDHAADFKIVHVLLGVVSVVLAAATVRVARRNEAPVDASGRRSSVVGTGR